MSTDNLFSFLNETNIGSIDWNIPSFTFLGLVVISIARIFIEEQIKEIEERTRVLENDPKCGIRTGGNDECFWDCEYALFDLNSVDLDSGKIIFVRWNGSDMTKKAIEKMSS